MVIELLVVIEADPNGPDVNRDAPARWTIRESSFDKLRNPAVVVALLGAGVYRLAGNAAWGNAVEPPVADASVSPQPPPR